MLFKFENVTEIIHFLISPLCSGLLLSGTFLFFYMALQHKDNQYISITFSAFIAFIFVSFETVLSIFGTLNKNAVLGMQLNRMGQITELLFITAVIFFIISITKLNQTWGKINLIILSFSLLIVFFITLIAFVIPDLFVSVTKLKNTAGFFRQEYGRGQEGIIYYVKNFIIILFILYSLLCVIFDLILHKNFKSILPAAIGLLIVLGGIVSDSIYSYTGNYPEFFLKRIYFLRFSLCFTIFVIILMSNSVIKFINSSKQIEIFNKLISISEQKYKILAEGTKDCIFSLNDDFYFINANNQTFIQFELYEENINKINFLDLIYSGPNDTGVTLEYVRKKMENLKTLKKNAVFKARLKSFAVNKPLEYELNFVYVNIHNRNEIIGKAVKQSSDVTMKYIHTENLKFSIDNYLLTAEDIINRLVMNLPKFIEPQEVNSIRLGLREIIINAIEHGNLSVTFEEKSKAKLENNYLNFIFQRQNNPKYKNRKVVIEQFLNPARVLYIITDEGRGFDYNNFMNKTPESSQTALLNGRGILMANNIFDEVEYNETGNKVSLVKYFI